MWRIHTSNTNVVAQMQSKPCNGPALHSSFGIPGLIPLAPRVISYQRHADGGTNVKSSTSDI